MEGGETRFMSKSSLKSIAAEVRACQRCPLATGRTKAVPGEGPSYTKIMLIGEAPGKDEDLSGKPFVGRAGRLLNSVLESVGTKRADVFVTNIVKCRPPDNRLPTRRERETCRDAYLYKQTEIVRPKVVVLLGRTAVQAILGIDSLREVRGKVVAGGMVRYLCTYHPAAVLRNPNLRETMVEDLRKIHSTAQRVNLQESPRSRRKRPSQQD